jgi:hypothetical protein
MDHSSASLIELVFNKTDRWNMRMPDQVSSYIPTNTEVYRSMYRWPVEAFDMIDEWKRMGKGNSGTSWAGNMIPDDIIIDLDLKLNSEEELNKEADEFYNAIGKFCPSDRFAIFNSGTGLHVHFCKSLFDIKPSPDVPYITKHVANALQRHIQIYKPCAIDTSIYHQVACYRMIGSINPKTGTRKRFLGGKYPFTFGEPVLRYMADYVVVEKPKHIQQTNVTEYPAMTPCMTKLWQLGFAHAKQEHGRHNTVLALAAWMLFNNMPKDVAEMSIINWIERSNITYDQHDTLRCIKEVYDGKVKFGCSSQILSTYCMSHCKLYERKNSFSSKIT